MVLSWKFQLASGFTEIHCNFWEQCLFFLPVLNGSFGNLLKLEMPFLETLHCMKLVLAKKKNLCEIWEVQGKQQLLFFRGCHGWLL